MIGRRGLRGRFSFWVGPVAVSFLNESWLQRWYIGRGGEGGFAIIDHGVRVQIGGAQPWRCRCDPAVKRGPWEMRVFHARGCPGGR